MHLYVNTSIIKPTNALKFKMYFLHTICHNSDMFWQIVWKKIYNFNFSSFVGCPVWTDYQCKTVNSFKYVNMFLSLKTWITHHVAMVRIWKETLGASSNILCQLCLKGLKKLTRNVRQGNRPSIRECNLEFLG